MRRERRSAREARNSACIRSDRVRCYEIKSIFRIFNHPIRLIREISGQTNPKNF